MNGIIQPRILAGFIELLPDEQILFNEMFDTVKATYENFGYLPLDTPTIEYSDVLLAKAGGETEKQIYRFTKGDNDMSLRFDLTVPLARYVSQHAPDLTFPFKRYQMAKSYRGERPQRGRFREFYQCDIDTVGCGSLDITYEAEMPAVIYDIFKKLNIGKFTVRINNRKILNGFFAHLGLENLAADVMRTVDKIDKIGSDKVKSELFSLGVSDEAADSILGLIGTTGSNADKISYLEGCGCDNEIFSLGVEELKTVLTLTAGLGVPEEYISVDLSIARGLDYYTGTVYETRLDDYPSLGSICSGGRYDNLAEHYSKESYPGVGVSIGLSRLFWQLRDANIITPTKKSLTDVLVIPMNRDALGTAVGAAATLRCSGLKTDIYYGDKGMKQKMKYADRLAIPYAVIIGGDEIASGTVTLKNMKTGEQSGVSAADAAEIIKKDVRKNV